MSKLQELIQELCPNGVEYKKLGDVCEIKRGEITSIRSTVHTAKRPPKQLTTRFMQ